MPAATAKISAQRIVVVMPNWLGDAVMATPFLRALRQLYPQAHIAATAVPLVGPVLAGLPFVNETYVHAKKESPAAWLRANRFDLGILLPNSFRSAWNLFRSRVPRRLGYARDRRSILLTHCTHALRKTPAQQLNDEAVRTGICLLQFEERIADGDLLKVEIQSGKFGKETWVEHRMLSTGHVARQQLHAYRTDGMDRRVLSANYQPVPTIYYYLELAKHLGAESPSRQMELAVTAEEQTEADAALTQIENQKSKIKNPILLVPGANFGSSKCWPPDRFAALSEILADPAGPFNADVLLATSPAERPIADAILAGITRHKDRVHALAALNNNAGISVGALKAITRSARLMICNDTGPRHFAAAFGIPTVTLFGPTDPIWAETFAAKETILRVPVPCGPCQLKQCPIDHRCMKGITVEMVQEAAKNILGNGSDEPVTGWGLPPAAS